MKKVEEKETEELEEKTESFTGGGNLNIKYTWWEKLLRPFFVMKIRMKERSAQGKYRRQRADKGYSDFDLWEIRTWFVHRIVPMLREMSDKANNHPEEMEFEEWQSLLRHMADLAETMDTWEDGALRKKLGIDEEDYSVESLYRISDEKEKAKEEFFTLFSKWFYHLWY